MMIDVLQYRILILIKGIQAALLLHLMLCPS